MTDSKSLFVAIRVVLFSLATTCNALIYTHLKELCSSAQAVRYNAQDKTGRKFEPCSGRIRYGQWVPSLTRGENPD